MARKRMLSPEFFTSGPVAGLPVTAMITFAGLQLTALWART